MTTLVQLPHTTTLLGTNFTWLEGIQFPIVTQAPAAPSDSSRHIQLNYFHYRISGSSKHNSAKKIQALESSQAPVAQNKQNMTDKKSKHLNHPSTNANECDSNRSPFSACHAL
jgi:hypothetical protein